MKSAERLIVDLICEIIFKSEDVFENLNHIYTVIADNDFSGTDIYLMIEREFDGKSIPDDILINVLDNAFLKYSYYEIDKYCKKLNISRYECWQRFSLVINCLQPVIFHYANEKEFIGTWCSNNREWHRAL